jgi:hypothetical protein
MGEFYHNAALEGHDGNAGCFRSRDPLRFFPCKIGKNLSHDICAYVNQERHWEWESDFNKETASLRTRAWAVQENILSPRTLNYASNMLLWDCCELQAWDSRPEGSLSRLDTGYKSSKRYLKKMVEAAQNTAAKDGDFEAPLHLRRLWGNIVTEFTNADLTFKNDKLIALSGIAEQMQTCTRSSYVAGLWRDGLLHYLCWRSEHRYEDHGWQNNKRPLIYIAPSWSWASLEGKITWNFPEQTVTWNAEILDVKIDIVDVGSPLGQLSGGLLRVFARLQIARKRHQRPQFGSHQFAGTELKFSSGGDLTIYWDTECPEIAFSEGVTCLMLCGEEYSTSGLVLTHVENREDYFQRVGYFSEYLYNGQRSSFSGEDDPREVIVI